MGAEITAPAHAYGGEHGYGIAVDPSLCGEVGHEAQGRAYGSEGCDGEGYEMGIVEPEEPLKHYVNL